MNHLKDANYELVEGAAWFAVKNFSVRIHSTDEGVIVDVWAKGREGEDLIAATYAFDAEVEDMQ